MNVFLEFFLSGLVKILPICLVVNEIWRLIELNGSPNLAQNQSKLDLFWAILDHFGPRLDPGLAFSGPRIGHFGAPKPRFWTPKRPFGAPLAPQIGASDPPQKDHFLTVRFVQGRGPWGANRRFRALWAPEGAPDPSFTPPEAPKWPSGPPFLAGADKSSSIAKPRSKSRNQGGTLPPAPKRAQNPPSGPPFLTHFEPKNGHF